MEELLKNFEIKNNCLTAETYGIREDTFYVLCPYGIGDTLYVAMYIKAYCEWRHIERPVCFIVKENHAVLPGWFPAIEYMIQSDDLVTVMNVWTVRNSFWRGDNYLYGHFPKRVDFQLTGEYGQAKEKNMIYRYRTIVMELSDTAVMEMPQIPILKGEDVKAVYGIDERVLLFMPYAASSAMVPMVFWEYLAEIFQKLGYKIYTNVKDETEAPVKGTIPISENLEKMASIGNASGGVIAMRSGICDILAQTETKLVVLNTTRYLHEEWDLHHATEREDILSLLYDSNEKAAAVAGEILKFFHINI